MRRSRTRSRADHDAYWKEAFDVFLPDLLHFFVPELATAIDWSKGYTIPEVDLYPDSPKSATGRGYPDRVYLVHLKNGDEAILYVHCEFQSQPTPDFAARMYVYHARLNLHLRRPICSLAILADADPNHRPNEYFDSRFGTELRFRFVACKLLDHASRIDELLSSGNVGAVLVAIKLIDLLVEDPVERLAQKKRVLRILASIVRQRGGWKELTRLLIEGIMLPDSLAREFFAMVRRIDKEQKVPFTTIYERQAEARGEKRGEKRALLRTKRDDVLRVLRARFRDVPERVVERVEATRILDRLDAFLEHAARARSIRAFEMALKD